MSDPAQLAKATREHLSAALNALQTAEDAPLPLLDLAEPIAASMGVLHRIERSGGADLTGREKVLENVRKCLDALQSMAGDHPAVDQVMEAIAGSLAKASALSRAQPKAAAAPAPSAPAAAAAPAPAAKAGPSQPGTKPATPAPRPLNVTQPLQNAPVVGPGPAATPAPIPLVPKAAPAVGLSLQSDFDPTKPHPVHVEPAGKQPAPQPAPAPQAVAPVAVQVVQAVVPVEVKPAPQPQPAPQAAPVQVSFGAPPQVQPQPAPVQVQGTAQTVPVQVAFGAPPAPPAPAAPQAVAQAGFQPQPVARAPQPQPVAQAPAARPSERGGAGSTVNVELGTRSASNFYKGLSGNDVIEHGGIFVATYKIPPVGAGVRLRVLLPGDYEFTADATVQWTREAGSGDAEPGFGARFTNIGQEGRQLVYRYTRNREPIFYDDF